MPQEIPNFDPDLFDRVEARVDYLQSLDTETLQRLMQKIDISIQYAIEGVEPENAADDVDAMEFGDTAAIESILHRRGVDVVREGETSIDPEESGLTFEEADE